MKAFLVLVALAGVAAADTGGSMGGGDWSSGPSLGHGSPSRNDTPSYEPPTFGTTNIPAYEPPVYTPPAHDYVPAYEGSALRGPISQDVEIPDFDASSDWTFDVLFALVAAFILGIWIKILFFADRPPRTAALANAFYTLVHRHDNDADVSVLRVALDGRARRFVQGQLAKIATHADTGTQEGRVQMLREVSQLVRQLRDAWVYGGAANEPMRGGADAKRAFDHHVDEARTRFREETIRNEDGAKTATAASEYAPRSDEGEGLILVSFVIAARKELFTVKKVGHGDDLRRALEAAFYLDEQTLVAIEIVWQPSEDADRLSSMELEAKYPPPELVKIAGALVGKAFCTFCGGPYPAELVSCPHCGAPAHQEAA